MEDLGHVQTDATLSFVEPRPNGSNVIDQQFRMLSPVETDATLLASNSKHCWELLRLVARRFIPSNALNIKHPNLVKTAQRWHGMGLSGPLLRFLMSYNKFAC